MALFFRSDEVFTPPPFSGLICKKGHKVRSDLFCQKHLLLPQIYMASSSGLVLTPQGYQIFSRGVDTLFQVTLVGLEKCLHFSFFQLQWRPLYETLSGQKSKQSKLLDTVRHLVANLRIKLNFRFFSLQLESIQNV